MSTFTDGVVPLSKPIDGEEYMRVLLDRQAAWETAHPGPGCFRPLLEWFIADGDEQWVRLPGSTPALKRETRPRVYRSASSIRAELDKVQAEMLRIAGGGYDDPAVVNLSPCSRSRAARTAGRRRFAQMDRDLERYANLERRRANLASRLVSAETREAKSINDGQAPAA